MKPEREFDSAGSLLRLVLPVDAPPNERTTRSAPRRASRTTNARTTETRPLSRPRDPAKSKESDSRVFVDATRAIRFLHGSVGWLIFTRKRRSVTGRTDRIGSGGGAPSVRRSVGPSARTNANPRRRRFPSSSSSSVSPVVVSRRQRQRWIVISPAGWISSSFVVWETDESRVFRRVFISRVFQTNERVPDFSGGCPGGCPGECPSASSRPGTRGRRQC